MILKMQNALSLTGLKKIVTIFVCLSVLISCSDVQEREEPDKLLSKDKMIEVYTDMILLDALRRSNPVNFKSYELKASEHIYNKFDVDSTTLSQNIKYYNLEFEANSDIFEQVKLNIEQKNEIYDSITKVRDSLKRLKTKKKKAISVDSVELNKKLKKINVK